jgi:hypothetical protein
MPLKHDDHRLSTRVSRRPKRNDSPPAHELRSLMVHRLRDTFKVVFRRSLRGGQVSAFCEYCDGWSAHLDETGITTVFTCAGCSRTFQLEFAVFSEVEEVVEP